MIILNNKPTEFILDSEKELDKSQQSVFMIKALSAKQYSIVSDLMKINTDDNGKTNISNSGKYTLETLRYGLVGWENVKDESGNDVKFNSKNMDENLDKLPIAVRYEISTAILNASMMQETERKN